MTSLYLWSQFFGAVAIPLNLLRFRQSSRKAILLWGFPVGVALILSQWCNDQYQGMAMSAASMASSLSQAPFGLDTRQHKVGRLVLALLFGLGGVWWFPPSSYWPTWIPLLAYLLGRLGEAQRSFLRLRIVWLGSTALWLGYYLLYANWAGAVLESMVFGMSLRFVVRAVRDGNGGLEGVVE